MDTTKMAVELFNLRAGDYQDKYMNVDLYADSLDLFCSSIEKQDPNVLELACGPGNVTAYLLNRRPDLQILGTDLAPNMIELARQNNPTATFQVLDVRDVGRQGQQYDAILCGFGLPYLSREDALQWITDAARALLPGGVLYFSTMEDDYSKSGIQYSSKGEPLYMFFHQADYLTAALRENGLTLIDLQRKQYPAPNGGTTTDLLVLARK
ncbi:MAG: class I SAM-dependent methyltransferase [Saprospiraceae bacterium]|nr:class I SAM-dependent methyltransferase [Saprospiraceae bacterium]